ncbi:hypothetical protein LB505_014005 [Fusarium chuoi]|nr:hypothetical protein LB505_014005 [Fusarium chuoi]
MRGLNQLFLILSTIAAVEASGVSNCRHRRHKNVNSEDTSTTVEIEKTGQSQTVISTILNIPTEIPQVTEPAINAGAVKSRQQETSGYSTASLSALQQTKGTTAAPKEPTKKFCGEPNESEVLFGTPWIVFSMNYNYQSIKGSSCVGYYNYEGAGDNQTIHWSVLWDIDPNVGTNLVKGYNFIGLTQGLETRLSDIKSIPSKYEWTTSKTTDYKGI